MSRLNRDTCPDSSHQRRGGDSNPRTRSTPVTRFPVAPVQPLRHLSVLGRASVARRHPDGARPGERVGRGRLWPGFDRETLRNHAKVPPNPPGGGMRGNLVSVRACSWVTNLAPEGGLARAWMPIVAPTYAGASKVGNSQFACFRTAGVIRLSRGAAAWPIRPAGERGFKVGARTVEGPYKLHKYSAAASVPPT